MIQIKNIEIEGFCSIVEPFSYNFDLPGITMIWGRNGAGKSTIFNALAWGLYGKLIKQKRSITPWKNLQTKRFSGTAVKVKFYEENVGYYTIIRTKGVKGFKDLILYKEGVEFPGRKKVEIENEIEKTLGVSFDLFKASVTFGQNLSRFLKLPSGSQKEILDEAFSINYINEARDKAKKERDLLVVEKTDIELKLSILDSEYTLIENNLKEIEVLKKNFDTDKNKRLREIRADIKILKHKIIGLSNSKKKSSELSYMITMGQTTLNQLETEMKSFKLLGDRIFSEDFELSNVEAVLRESKHKRKEFKILLSKPALTCFTCGQIINKEKKEEQRNDLKIKIGDLNNKILELGDAVEHRKRNLESLKEKHNKLSGIEKIYNDAQKNLNDQKNSKLMIGAISENLRLAIKNKNQLIKKLRETLLLKFGYKMENQRTKLKIIKNRIVNINFTDQKLRKQIKLHDWVINDPLSNKGIKAYIFNLMIQKINIKLNEYGRKVGFGIKLSIDLESANKTFGAEISKGDQVVSYDDLSGGEEQLVDACLAFSMHDVISNNRFNILLLDEVFESLDKENIDLIYEIIDFKSKTSNIHLISHRRSFINRANSVTQL